MNDYKRQNRIGLALSMRGMKQVELCEKTGIFKTSINGWINQKYQPKQEALYKMAKALDVSEMWLAGYDVPMERPVEQTKFDQLAFIINELRKNDRLKSVVNDIAMLTEDQVILIEAMVKQMKKD